jgi:hypothetical protein
MKNTSPNKKNKIKLYVKKSDLKKNSRHLSKNNIYSMLLTKRYFNPKS